MPSKPLFGMPVVVGTSAAVIAIRSVVSAAAADAPNKPAASASAQQALRANMTTPIQHGTNGRKSASFRPARDHAMGLHAGCAARRRDGSCRHASSQSALLLLLLLVDDLNDLLVLRVDQDDLITDREVLVRCEIVVVLRKLLGHALQ